MEGVGLFHRKSIGVKQHNLQFQPITFQYLDTITCNARPVHLIIIYRPPHPPPRQNGFKTSTFLLEFQELSRDMACRSGSLLIAGDLNLHLDQPCRPEVKGFMDLLESADLKQQVRSKTHISGHLLDLYSLRDPRTTS